MEEIDEEEQNYENEHIIKQCNRVIGTMFN